MDRLRFPAPVRSGSKIRAEVTLTDIKQTPLGWLASIRVRIQIEGQKKAACIADTLSLYVA
jgi:acyl dehydratase